MSPRQPRRSEIVCAFDYGYILITALPTKKNTEFNTVDNDLNNAMISHMLWILNFITIEDVHITYFEDRIKQTCEMKIVEQRLIDV